MTATLRPLLVLKLGSAPEPLRGARGDFEDWIARGLGDALPLQVVDPRRGGPLPAPGTLAGAVVSGSHTMVTERTAWSEATAAWLAGLVAARVPVLGICYGHQLLAHALGGTVGDHPRGSEVGTVSIDLLPAAADDALFRGLAPHFAANAIHRQSALALPPHAVRLACNGWDPHQAFRMGACAWGVQFHPEFDADAMQGYVDTLSPSADPAPRVAPTPVAAQLLPRFAALAAQGLRDRAQRAAQDRTTTTADAPALR